MGLVTVHVYIPLSFVVTLPMVQSARNTALVLICVSVVILVDCTIGSRSFLHVNVSEGEPHEVQDSVREEPVTTVMVNDDRGSMS